MPCLYILQHQKKKHPGLTEQENSAADPEDQIRVRAYFMWEADGKPDGGADQYWR
jgi:hypothetical protein